MKKKLGNLLIEAGLITKEQLSIALKNRGKKRLGQVLVEMQFASEKDISQTLSSQTCIPFIDLGKAVVEPVAVMTIDEKTASKNLAFPFQIEKNTIAVAMENPLDLHLVNDLQFKTGRQITPFIATASDIKMSVQKHYHLSESLKENSEIQDIFREFQGDQEINVLKEKSSHANVQDLIKKSEIAPIIKIVNIIIAEGIKSKASDIHLEAHESKVLVRNRVDGVLRTVMELPKWLQGGIISRIKIMGNMDITEKRIPQDGKTKAIEDHKKIDLRLSTLPTNYGEKVVIRILDKSDNFALSDLGLNEINRGKILNIVDRSQGVILVTGPTGSGKTTSLYAFLMHINSEKLNIITLEDPIEYELPGINQVPINPKAGLTFANGLRSILRQDPDVIMVGEIRDLETASIAMGASLTGHLVFSTVHTNDTMATIIRLLDMGVPSYILGSSVIGIIAQRLVRVLCNHCKEEYIPSLEELGKVGILNPSHPRDKFYRAKGCNECEGSGYRGRKGIYEILAMSDQLRSLINNKASEGEVRKKAISEGLVLLAAEGISAIKEGITSIEEVAKVLSYEDTSLICSQCNSTLNMDFVACPYCGHNIIENCPVCQQRRETEWVVCPYCRHAYEQAEDNDCNSFPISPPAANLPALSSG